MSEAEWIGAYTLATLASISPQAARKALKQRSWRGRGLTVRMLPGRGGRSGLRYEVAVASLPDDLQLRHRQALAAELDPSILRSDEAAAAWRTWWGVVTLGPALAHRKGTKARAGAIAAIASRMHATSDIRRDNITDAMAYLYGPEVMTAARKLPSSGSRPADVIPIAGKPRSRS